jgi:hypothetical protein
VKTFTDAEFAALPIAPWDTPEIVTDPVTHESRQVRPPPQFVVNDTPWLFVTDGAGQQWQIARTADGQYVKFRWRPLQDR